VSNVAALPTRRTFGVVRGGIRLPCQRSFVRLSAPVPFACAEGFWIPGLIDEFNCYLSPLTVIK
jgi:hypothetical protein